MNTTAPAKLPAAAIGVLIVPSRLAAAFVQWLPRADIPNTPGFQFVGQSATIPGAGEVCEVVKGADGCHTLKRDAFKRITAWRHLTDEDRETIKGAE